MDRVENERVMMERGTGVRSVANDDGRLNPRSKALGRHAGLPLPIRPALSRRRWFRSLLAL